MTLDYGTYIAFQLWISDEARFGCNQNRPTAGFQFRQYI